MEILLPVLDEGIIAGKEPSGNCFRVSHAKNAKIMLSCVDSSNVRRTAIIADNYTARHFLIIVGCIALIGGTAFRLRRCLCAIAK